MEFELQYLLNKTQEHHLFSPKLRARAGLEKRTFDEFLSGGQILPESYLFLCNYYVCVIVQKISFNNLEK